LNFILNEYKLFIKKVNAKIDIISAGQRNSQKFAINSGEKIIFAKSLNWRS